MKNDPYLHPYDLFSHPVDEQAATVKHRRPKPWNCYALLKEYRNYGTATTAL